MPPYGKMPTRSFQSHPCPCVSPLKHGFEKIGVGIHKGGGCYRACHTYRSPLHENKFDTGVGMRDTLKDIAMEERLLVPDEAG